MRQLPKNQFVPTLGVLVLITTVGCASVREKLPGRSPHYQVGEVVVVTGVVTNAASEPLADVEVLLTATNNEYDYLRFRKKTPIEKKAGARTTEDGGFELQWPWNKAYDRFELEVGVTVAKPGGEDFHVLHAEDLSKRMRHGSPVVSTIRLEDTEFLTSFQEFRAQIEPGAQEEVYRDAGKPDKVQRRVLPNRTETDWWYFEVGKVYRFSDGELDEVEEFEPVINPFSSPTEPDTP